MNQTELKILTNLLIMACFPFATIGMTKLVVNWYKSEVGTIKIILNLATTLFIITIVPLLFIVLAVYGLVITILFLKTKSKKKVKPHNIDLHNPDHFHLESENGIIEISNPYRGIMIEGGAGSGKSKSFFYPILKQIMGKNYCGLLYDFKSPELSEFTYAMHAKSNSKVNFKLLDFKNHNTSSRINPLAPRYLTKQAIAFELSAVLINNLLPENIKKPDYWSRSSISIVAGCIWYLRNNHPEQCSLPHLIAMILDFPSSKLIDVISKDLECVGMISSIKEAHEMKAEKQLSGVVGTIKNAFAQLNFPELFYLLSSDDVNLDLNNKENPTFLCIGNDSTLSNTFAPIISLIISVCLRKMNEANKTRSAVILDEAPTLYIPNLEQIPATARSNRISTIIGLQDYSQMVDKYGSDKAQVLISNLGNQFYGRTVNERSAKMITALFGNEDKEYKSSSVSRGSSSEGNSSTNVSTSKSIQQRDRVKISDITNLPAGKFYGIIAEGNHKELLGVQFNQVESEYKAFESLEEVDASSYFKKVYNEVNEIKNPAKQNITNDIKIELN